jgi:integrase
MADSVLAVIRAQVAKGVVLQAAVDEYAPVSSEANRIDRYLADYLEEQEDRASRLEISPNHLRELRRCARDDGAFAWWSGASIYEIDAKAIADWRRWLSRERGLSPKSVRNILGYFRAFVAWLYQLDLIDRVPAFPAMRVPDHSPTILSGTTQRAILDRIPFERRGAFLAACHGVRPGEIRALDTGDLQEREDVPGLRIRRAIKGPNSTAPIGDTKTGEAAWIPIDEELAEWLRWRLGERREAVSRGGPAWALSPALFPNPTSRNPERRWIANALRLEWNRAARSVGVKVRMYEGTKHSSASRWHSSGMPLELVRRMLRHRDARSTERYAKLSDWALVEAFGAHHERDRTRQQRGRAHGVLMSPNRVGKPQRKRAPMAGRTGLEPARNRSKPLILLTFYARNLVADLWPVASSGRSDAPWEGTSPC